MYTEVTVPLTIPADWYDSFLPSFTELQRKPLVHRSHCSPDHPNQLVRFILTELYRTPEEPSCTQKSLFPGPSQPTGTIHSYRVLQNSRGTLLYTEVTVPLTIPTDWYDSFFAMTITHWEKQDLNQTIEKYQLVFTWQLSVLMITQ